MSHSGLNVQSWSMSRVAASMWAVPWVALMVADVVLTPACHDVAVCGPDLGAPSYWLAGLSITALFVPLALILAPGVGIWFAVGVAAGLGVIDPLERWWWGLALALAIYGLTRGWVIARQRRAAGAAVTAAAANERVRVDGVDEAKEAGGADEIEEADEIEGADGVEGADGTAAVTAARVRRLAPSPVLGVWLPIVALMGAVVLAGWHQVRWEDARSYANFAPPKPRVVVIDGSVDALEVPPGAVVVVSGDFSVASSGGVRLEVWIQTTPEVTVVHPARSDPSWLLGLAVGLLGIGLAARARWGLSTRQVEAIVAGPRVSASVATVGRGAAILDDRRAVGYLDPVRLAGFEGASDAEPDQDETDSGFDFTAPVEVLGPLTVGSPVVIRQGESLAMARLEDPWPWRRWTHPRSWLGSDQSDLDVDDVLDQDDPNELPTDAPLL